MKQTFNMAAVAALLASSPALALQNGDFGDLDRRAFGETLYTNDSPIAALPSWTLISNTPLSSGVIETRADFAALGDSVFRFETLSGGFGDNKLDQCILIDPAQDIHFSYQARTNAASVDNDLRTRISANFYTDMALCEEDLQANETTQRITEGAAANLDRDVRFGTANVEAHTWHLLDTATHGTPGPMVHAAADMPDGAQVVRLSLRARYDAVAANPDTIIWLDDVRVTQNGVNLVRNSSFEHIDVTNGAFLLADTGWFVSRDDDTQRAAAGEVSFALGSGNVFYFDDLTGGFGTSRLDQCVAVTGTDDLRPSLRATSFVPHDELQVRINLDFYASTDCSGSNVSALRIQEDFPVNPAIGGEWADMSTSEFREAAALADVSSALLSLRARDRSNAEGNGPGTFVRTLYLEDVQLVDGVSAPVFNPPSQDFSSETLQITLNGPVGSTLHYTLDGSEPDSNSASLQPGETLDITETTTVRAIALLDGALSPVRSATYTKITGPVTPPAGGPRTLSTGSAGLFFSLFGLLLVLRRR